VGGGAGVGVSGLTNPSTPASPGWAPSPKRKYATNMHGAEDLPGQSRSDQLGLPKAVLPLCVLRDSSVTFEFDWPVGTTPSPEAK
jgi:hypothetical protein